MELEYGILNGGKTLRERILKKIFPYKIHCSEYQLVKSRLDKEEKGRHMVTTHFLLSKASG